MHQEITLALTVLLPIAWLVADFQGTAVVRRVVGMIALLWSFGIAAMVGMIRDFNANSYFTFASKDLLEASAGHLRAGKNEVVLREWTRLIEEFHPTYENRAQYRELVDQAIEGMKK